MTREPSPASNHQKLYDIAEQQAGFFTSRQALEVGFTWPLLSYNTRTGRFIRVRRGIYRLARFPEMPFSDLFVAWLQTGQGSAISHDTALAVYGLSDVLPSQVHITVPRTSSRRRPGIRLHTRRLPAGDVNRYMGLDVTTVSRTIADLVASGLGDEQIQQAIKQALERGLVTEQALARYAERRGGRMAVAVNRAFKKARRQ